MTLWSFLLFTTLLIRFDLVYSKEKEDEIDYQQIRQNMWKSMVTKHVEQIATDIEESLSTVRVAQDYACVEYDALKDTYWALKWADNFKEAGANLSDWEIPNCTVPSPAHVAMCSSANVQLRSGVLLLLAKEVSPVPKQRFTSALAYLPHPLTFDRLHLRLALPLGSHLSTSIMAYDAVPLRPRIKGQPDEVHRHFENRLFQGRTLPELAQADAPFLELFNFTQTVRPLSHKIFLDETTHLKGVHQGAAESGELSHFHNYGVQWTEDGLEFSLDDGGISRLAHRRLRRVKRQLMFIMAVGAPVFGGPVPEESEALNWICPALIVDSVRVYDRVSEELAKNLERCTFPKPTDDSVIEEICPKLKSLPNWRKTPKKMTGNAQTIGRIVFLVALGCILPVAIYLLVKFTFLGNSRALKMKITYRRNEPILQLVDVHDTDSVN